MKCFSASLNFKFKLIFASAAYVSTSLNLAKRRFVILGRVEECKELGIFKQALKLLFLIYFSFSHYAYSQCKDSLVGERRNLGLYGGECNDLTFSSSRIFAAVKAPYSLLYSDDTTKTWKVAFPIDSLYFECDQRGWGGMGFTVLANSKKWVMARTSAADFPISATVVSFNNGDSGTWQTAVDPYLLSQIGFGTNFQNNGKIRAIALSDHFIYSACDYYLVRQDSTLKLDSSNIYNLNDFISYTSNPIIRSIASVNDSSGFPVYLAVDTAKYDSEVNRELYKFNGDTAIKLNLPIGFNGIYNVFSHPYQISGDTIYISGIDTVTNKGQIYQSDNGGLSWNKIYEDPNLNFQTFLTDVDYSPTWKIKYPQSEGLVLITNNGSVSIDLGNTWISLNNPNHVIYTASAISPNDTNLIIVADPKTILYSANGISDSLLKNKNIGYEAITINDIAIGPEKSVVYLATHNGLAYTTVYTDTTVEAVNKWSGNYGQFPVMLDTSLNASSISTAKINCVQVNPNDSLHVIAGMDDGISITSSGPNGFIHLSLFDTLIDDPSVTDVEFITSQIVLLVTNAWEENEAPAGNIWKSTDGGYTWTNVSPSGFNSGNSIAVGYANNDTTIYVGCGYGSIDPGYLWKSKDLGVTWNMINTGPSSLDSTESNLPILDIAINPHDNDSIYLAAGSTKSNKYAIIKSGDGGVTYKQIQIKALDAFNSILIKKTSVDTIFAASGGDVYLYDAKNDTSTLIFKAYPGELIPDLANGSVLAGTTSGFYGIWYDDIEDNPPTYILKQELTKDELFIFPNPAFSVVGLHLNTNYKGEITLRLFDLYGKLIRSKVIESEDNQMYYFHLDNLTVGTYFVEVCYDTHKQYAKLFIVK